jgi:hypothetical protein
MLKQGINTVCNSLILNFYKLIRTIYFAIGLIARIVIKTTESFPRAKY